MKFLRVGRIDREKPAVIDNNGIIRDISSLVTDLDSNTINPDLIDKIKKTDISELPEISKKERRNNRI